MQRLADTHRRSRSGVQPDSGASIQALAAGVSKEIRRKPTPNGKEYAKAEQEAEAAFKKWPNDRGVRLGRAALMAEMGKADAAAADVKKLLDGRMTGKSIWRSPRFTKRARSSTRPASLWTRRKNCPRIPTRRSTFGSGAAPCTKR
jgi:hypothetical protein